MLLSIPALTVRRSQTDMCKVSMTSEYVTQLIAKSTVQVTHHISDMLNVNIFT